MDITTIGGLILGIGAVLFSFFMEGGHISAIIRIPAMIIVIFGAIGATIITTSFDSIKSFPKLIKIAFFPEKQNAPEIIKQIVNMARSARRDGILGLEPYLNEIKNPFYNRAVQLLIDGTEMTELRDLLEMELDNITKRHKAGISLFQKLGGFSPTMGIIGTVLGLIHSLANTDDAGKMASSIASAFIATLWGVALANLVYLPIGDKLRRRHEEEIRLLNIILEGVVSIQSGENPRIIKTKLLSFIEPENRKVR